MVNCLACGVPVATFHLSTFNLRLISKFMYLRSKYSRVIL